MTNGSSMFPVRDSSTRVVESEKVLVLRQKAAVLEQPTCDHEWKRFKQRIEPYRTPQQEAQGMVYDQGRAYFVVNACLKCHIKRIINMRIEKP